MTEPTSDGMTVLESRVEPFFVLQREQPRDSGQWVEWSRKRERDEIVKVRTLWQQAYPQDSFRIRRGFKTTTIVMEN